MDTNGYPTDEELDTIEKWDFRKNGIEEFLSYIRDNWEYADIGYYDLKKSEDGKIWNLELHTGGWSGNECMIDSINNNFVFWAITWRKSELGGHYYFEIKPELFKNEKGVK